MKEATKDCPRCKSDCQLTTYSTTMSSSEFRCHPQWKYPIKYPNRIFLRVCDSRNLNLSPFCNLSSQSLPKWQPEINSTYGNSSTSYTSALPGPMRPRYPGQGKSGAERELLVSLTQVFERNQSESSTVNVLGERLLQCLWQGHSCCEHLLWKSNCIWYWNITFSELQLQF